MHETIDEFFKKVKNENISFPELVTDEEKVQSLVDDVVEEKLDMGKKIYICCNTQIQSFSKKIKKNSRKGLKIHN